MRDNTNRAASDALGTLIAGLERLGRVQVGPNLVSTYGPVRHFFNRQNMMSRNPAGTSPRTNGALRFEAQRVNEFGLPPGRLGSLADDVLDVHAIDSNAQTARDVNANSASCGPQAADMVLDARKTFGQRLAECWGERGLPTTQLGIAKRLGMSQGSTGRWFRDQGLPELDRIRELAKMGDVCVEWLISGLGTKRPMPVDEETNELLEIWRQLNPNGRHHVRIAARAMLADQKSRKAAPQPVAARNEIHEE